MLAKRIEIAPDRSREKRYILTDDCLVVKQVTRIPDKRRRWSYDASPQILKPNGRDVNVVDPFGGQLPPNSFTYWHMTHRILPPLGSTILNNDSARVDFPDPVLPT